MTTKQTPPKFSPLSLAEFMSLVDDPESTESDIAPYFVLDENRAYGIDPRFRINEALVLSEPGLESALLMNSANFIAKQLRHRNYTRKIRRSPTAIRVVAEGDSWFQYPFILHDLIDHVMDREEVAVLCFSEAGDLISNIVAQGEFYAPIERERSTVFLISGGGNDLVDGPGLQRFLHQYTSERVPSDYTNTFYRAFMDGIRAQYKVLFTRILRLPSSPQIICHGYSGVIPQPNTGKWLGKPMSEIGINDARLQKQIFDIILDDLNNILKNLAQEFSPKVTYIDLRGVVSANGWHDEFHPTSESFGFAAEPIINEILKHS